MEKVELAISVAGLVLMYFAIEGKRLQDLKVRLIWMGVAIMMYGYAQNLYTMARITRPMTIERMIALNASALGMILLLCIAVFLKLHLRKALAKNRDWAGK
ncbi:hypothetical protein [Pseudomonas sp. RIT-To-2]|uniref:hypothetical protein n=1 Tax=Pseudomonas sp. RIT-To-2 TaxID=3462541 RepID=UPI0024139B38